MDEQAREALLDLIYGAIVEPVLWSQALERIADGLGGQSAWLSQLSREDGSGSGVIARIDPEMPGRYLAYYSGINPFCRPDLPALRPGAWRPTITTDEDRLPKADLVAGEYYADFLRPQSIHNVLMIGLAARGQELATVNINRSYRQGQFQSAERDLARWLHPHLIRAFRLSDLFAAKLAMNETLAAVLDRMVQGICVLDAAGRVIHCNRSAERIIGASPWLTIAGGRLAPIESRARNTLSGLIARATAAPPSPRLGGDVAIGDGEARLMISVAPLAAQGLSIIATEPGALVCITQSAQSLSLSECQMHDLFALTPAEAHVAALVLRGHAPREAAALLDVSLATVRTHLAHIFDKTGTSGQADLSRLFVRLAAASPLGPNA